jgi:DNA-binding GntR family transcriptional regulator
MFDQTSRSKQNQPEIRSFQHEAGMKTTPSQKADGLTPVARETVQDRVYAQLRQTLIDGGFEQGDMLRIMDLAERLQTSTMPVREALGRLVSEQALEALPNRSIRVPLITRHRLDDLERARTLIEGRLVQLALPNLKADDLTALRQINRQCDAAFEQHGQDIGPVTSQLNQRFHFHIYRAAGSNVLIPIVESLWLQSGPIVRVAAQIHDQQGGLAATDHHWAMIDAMERGDVIASMRSLEQDIGRSFDLVRSRLTEDEEAA